MGNSKNYYTNVRCAGNNILFRGVINGERVIKRYKYSPTLYLPTNEQTDFHSFFGEPVKPKKFNTISDCRNFIKQFEDVEGFKYFGNTNFEYAFIADHFNHEIHFDMSKLRIFDYDIETDSSDGFPKPETADRAILTITIIVNKNDIHVWSCKDYVPRKGEIFVKCEDEFDLLNRVLQFWKSDYPDILTGWNTSSYDDVFVVNRFRRVLGEKLANQLSPFGIVREKVLKGKFNKDEHTVDIYGISQIDYLPLYKLLAKDGVRKESYRLQNIAQEEIGEGKTEYEEDYGSLARLYEDNHQLFIEYNINDVKLVDKIDDKLKLMELAVTLAYDTFSNYEDIFTQTRMWDSNINCYLKSKNIVIPQKSNNEPREYEGGYVKPPITGLHGCVASFDLNSLHPHIMMQYHISPENLIEPEDYTPEMRKVVSEGVTVEKLLNKKIDLSWMKGKSITMTPNGQFYRTNDYGVLPEMLDSKYQDRKMFKNKMLEAENRLEKGEYDDKEQLENDIKRYYNIQWAKKISLNSAYGATGSRFFRYYDYRLAESVTLGSQLSVQWAEKYLNNYLNKCLNTDGIDYAIYMDTDSVYLDLQSVVDKYCKDKSSNENIIDFMDYFCKNYLENVIEIAYEDLAKYVNVPQNKMKMKREALAIGGVWVAKKRYALNVYDDEGVRLSNPKLKVVGLEIVKSSTPKPVKEKLKEAVNIILNKDEQTLQKFVKDFRKEFNTLPIEDVSFPSGVNDIGKYESGEEEGYKKGTPIRQKASINYNRKLKEHKLDKIYSEIREGDKLKYVYLKQPNPVMDTVIAFPSKLPKEFNLDKYVNYNMQFEKAFIKPLENITSKIGWDIEKKNTLF